MKNNSFSIIITLNLENKSDGIIYVEGEESLEYQNNKYSSLFSPKIIIFSILLLT